jgi:hypothetical protein
LTHSRTLAARGGGVNSQWFHWPLTGGLLGSTGSMAGGHRQGVLLQLTGRPQLTVILQQPPGGGPILQQLGQALVFPVLQIR